MTSLIHRQKLQQKNVATGSEILFLILFLVPEMIIPTIFSVKMYSFGC
jgi:hypothetical protein